MVRNLKGEFFLMYRRDVDEDASKDEIEAAWQEEREERKQQEEREERKQQEEREERKQQEEREERERERQFELAKLRVHQVIPVASGHSTSLGHSQSRPHSHCHCVSRVIFTCALFLG
jgi:hypothetical protein